MAISGRATPGRVAAFSDGVFAVIITIMVLDLRPPHDFTFQALIHLWPTLLSTCPRPPSYLGRKLCQPGVVPVIRDTFLNHF